MARVLLLPPDKRAEASLVHALSQVFQVQVVDDFQSLLSALEDSPAQGCVLDVFAPPPPISHESLQRLRREHPDTALVVASEFRSREMDLYYLGSIPVDGVIRMDTSPSSREIQGAVDRSLASALAARTRRVLEGVHPPLVLDALGWAIEHADARPHVSDLATALALTPRSLTREFRVAGIVPPRSLLIWGRLLWASHLLERPPETVESVAFRMGYATGGGLGKIMARYAGCSPTNLLEKGGVEWVLEILARRGLRPKGKERGK